MSYDIYTQLATRISARIVSQFAGTRMDSEVREELEQCVLDEIRRQMQWTSGTIGCEIPAWNTSIACGVLPSELNGIGGLAEVKQ